MSASGRIRLRDLPAAQPNARTSRVVIPTLPQPKAASTTQRASTVKPSLAQQLSWASDSFHFSSHGAEPLNFAPPEHQGLGDAATGGEVISELNLGDGTTLSFGDLVALSGDYFTCPAEIRQLAATDEGRAELRWARWTALEREAPEPDVSAEVKQRVRDRFFELTASNSGHFSQGGTAVSNYERGHAEALRKAREAGATGNDALFAAALTDEACCQHYLSDCFSAGHVRTPVIAIRDYYSHAMPDSFRKILNYAADRVAQALDDLGDVPWYWPDWKFQQKVLDTIESTAGKTIESFSLGDIVSLSVHNADGDGLNVVSELDPSGAALPGGFHWRAFGDNKLVEGSTTWDMAVAAMRASRAELDEARAKAAKGEEPSTSAVEGFIPRADEGRNPPIKWQWGSMDARMVLAIDTCLRGELVQELRRNAPQPPIQRFDRFGSPDPQGAVVLHVGAAFETFCRELEEGGINVLERAIGSTAGAVLDSSDSSKRRAIPASDRRVRSP